MFNKGKIAAAFLLTVSAGASAFAQQTQTAPQRVEREMQIFTSGDADGGYLGVQMQEVTKENFAKFGLPGVRGVAVEKVLDNSPAALAGLQTGDVIVRFGGEEVTSARKLSRLISEIAPDHPVKMTVLRNNTEREIAATVGKRPAAQFQTSGTNLGDWYGLPGIPEYQTRRLPLPPLGNGGENLVLFGNSRQIGVEVTVLNKQLGEYFGVADGKGILINNVIESSPASRVGLKAGDVITEIDGNPIVNSLDLVRAVNEKNEGDVNLTIVRNKNRQTIKVTPEKSKAAETNRMREFNFQGSDN